MVGEQVWEMNVYIESLIASYAELRILESFFKNVNLKYLKHVTITFSVSLYSKK
jgi:hypothetical protein